MKSKTLFAAVIILSVALSAQCMAQSDPHKLPPPGPFENIHRQALQQVTTFNGQAGEWTINDDYIYDGFYLQTTQAKYLVKFSPHMGSELTKNITTGATITINGVEELTPEGQKEVRLISIAANGQTLTDIPLATAPQTVTDTQINGTGKITAFQKNKRGEVNGYFVDGKTILRVPPHVVMQLNTLLTSGAAVSYSGIKKSVNNGEVSIGNYNIVHCQTITVNGTQYLTR